MWKIGLFFLLVLTAQVKASPLNSVTLSGGLMKFQGDVIADTCVLDTSNKQMTIFMGQVSSNRFKQAGSDADPVIVSLHFQHCSMNVQRNMAVVFRGVADSSNPDILAIQKGNNAATGVGIALFDEHGNLLPINSGEVPLTPEQPGPLTLNFVAKYRSTATQVTGGLANAQAWFSLTYQ